jgi:hypothetical protein
MENARLRKSAPTSVNVTVGRRSREYLTEREVERLIEAPLRHLLPRRRVRQFQLSSSSALTRCRLALLPASTGRVAM